MKIDTPETEDWIKRRPRPHRRVAKGVLSGQTTRHNPRRAELIRRLKRRRKYAKPVPRFGRTKRDRSILKHKGPGPHPSGSPQAVHAGGFRRVWHLTQDPKFQLDPEHVPDQNYVSIYYPEKSPGLYVTDNPEYWVNMHNYVTPFIAEIEVPRRTDQMEDFTPPGPSRQDFIPASEFARSRVVRVLPLDEWVREEYQEPGWVEDWLSEEKIARFPEGYKYEGDARDLTDEQVAELRRRTTQYLQEVRGVGKRDVRKHHAPIHPGTGTDQSVHGGGGGGGHSYEVRSVNPELGTWGVYDRSQERWVLSQNATEEEARQWVRNRVRSPDEGSARFVIRRIPGREDQSHPLSSTPFGILDTQEGFFVISDLTLEGAENILPNYRDDSRYVVFRPPLPSVGDPRILDLQRSSETAGLSVISTRSRELGALLAQARSMSNVGALTPGDRIRFTREVYVNESEGFQEREFSGTVMSTTDWEVMVSPDEEGYGTAPLRINHNNVERKIGQQSLFDLPSNPTLDMATLDNLLSQRAQFRRESLLASGDRTMRIHSIEIEERTQRRADIIRSGVQVVWEGPAGYGQGRFVGVDPDDPNRVLVGDDYSQHNRPNASLPIESVGLMVRGGAEDPLPLVDEITEYRPVVNILGESYPPEYRWFPTPEQAAEEVDSIRTTISSQQESTLTAQFMRDYIRNETAIGDLLDRVDVADHRLTEQNPEQLSRITQELFNPTPHFRYNQEIEGLTRQEATALVDDGRLATARLVAARHDLLRSFRTHIDETGDFAVIQTGLLAAHGEGMEWGAITNIDPESYDTSDYEAIPEAIEEVRELAGSFFDASTALGEMREDDRYTESQQELFSELEDITYELSRSTFVERVEELQVAYNDFDYQVQQERELEEAQEEYDEDYGYNVGGEVGNGKYEREEFGEMAFGGEYPLSNRKVRVVSDGNEYRGTILNADGDSIGRFEFVIQNTDAHMNYMAIDEGAQGDGFATELLLNKAGPLFLDAGITDIYLSANITVGGYAWAKYPLEFADGSPPYAARVRLQSIADLDQYIEEVQPGAPQVEGQQALLPDLAPVPVKQVSAEGIQKLVEGLVTDNRTSEVGRQLSSAIGNLSRAPRLEAQRALTDPAEAARIWEAQGQLQQLPGMPADPGVVPPIVWEALGMRGPDFRQQATGDIVATLQRIVTPRAVQETRALVERIDRGDRVMPYEIAYLGANSAQPIPGMEHNWHVGKMALIGTHWPGHADVDDIKHLFGSQQ